MVVSTRISPGITDTDLELMVTDATIAELSAWEHTARVLAADPNLDELVHAEIETMNVHSAAVTGFLAEHGFSHYDGHGRLCEWERDDMNVQATWDETFTIRVTWRQSTPLLLSDEFCRHIVDRADYARRASSWGNGRRSTATMDELDALVDIATSAGWYPECGTDVTVDKAEWDAAVARFDAAAQTAARTVLAGLDELDLVTQTGWASIADIAVGDGMDELARDGLSVTAVTADTVTVERWADIPVLTPGEVDSATDTVTFTKSAIARLLG